MLWPRVVHNSISFLNALHCHGCLTFQPHLDCLSGFVEVECVLTLVNAKGSPVPRTTLVMTMRNRDKEMAPALSTLPFVA